MRNTRTSLPFDIELVEFEKILHPNTNEPKSFSSNVNLIEDGIPRNILIKMNEPLRHGGYTFYQAKYVDKGYYAHNEDYQYKDQHFDLEQN